MAAVSRQIRKCFLLALPPGTRRRMLDRFPNFRKAAPDGMKFVFDRYLGSIKVNIDTHFTVEKYMWTGVYDRDLTELIRRHVAPGNVCFDIGANVGPISLALAQQVGPDGRVVAVEAAPPTCARLQANLDLNSELKKRVVVLAQGVGSEAGKLYWRETPGNPGNGELGPAGDVEVPIVTVDSISAALELARVDFVKIDVEGMELAVFQGARDTLARFKPMLFFETLPRFKNAGGPGNFRRISDFLGGFGYRLYRVGSGGQLTETTVDNLTSNTVAMCGQP